MNECSIFCMVCFRRQKANSVFFFFLFGIRNLAHKLETVECYHQLRPLQATTIVTEDDLVCGDVGACATNDDGTGGGEHCGDKPPSPALAPQNTTIWPSQFKCQDLSCSMACSKLKPMDEQVVEAIRANKSGLIAPQHVEGFGNSLDGTVTDEGTTTMISSCDQQQQQHEQSTAAVAATLAHSYFNTNPRIFDLSDLDLESGEWNWDLNENDVGGFLGLFKLGDTAPPLPAAAAAAATTTTTTTTATFELPPLTTTTTPDTPPTSPKLSSHYHANVGSCGSGKKVRQLEILQEHLQHQEDGEDPPPKKKKKKQK
jgi:hypothetical protein